LWPTPLANHGRLEQNVLPVGCAAPITRPSLSHSADQGPGGRTRPWGQSETPDSLFVGQSPGPSGGFTGGCRDSLWTDYLPNNNTGLLIGLAVAVIIIVATLTVWR